MMVANIRKAASTKTMASHQPKNAAHMTLPMEQKRSLERSTGGMGSRYSDCTAPDRSSRRLLAM